MDLVDKLFKLVPLIIGEHSRHAVASPHVDAELCHGSVASIQVAGSRVIPMRVAVVLSYRISEGWVSKQEKAYG